MNTWGRTSEKWKLHIPHLSLTGFGKKVVSYFGWDKLSKQELAALLVGECAIVTLFAALFYIAVINIERYGLTFAIERSFGIETRGFVLEVPFLPLLLIVASLALLGSLSRIYIKKEYVAGLRRNLVMIPQVAHVFMKGRQFGLILLRSYSGIKSFIVNVRSRKRYISHV